MATENILVGYAKIWYAPVGTAFPDETTIGYGTAWGGAWNYLGDTLEPLELAVDRETFEVEIQQSNSPVKQSITKQTINLNTTLAEHTVANLQLAFLGTASSTASGSGQKPYSQLAFGGETAPDVYAWGFEVLYQTSANVNEPVRYLFWKGSLSLNGNISFDKGAAAGIPVSIIMLADTTKPSGIQTGYVQQVTGS